MSNISVAEILKLHGKWIETSKFAALVADKLKISERHAYNLIKKAWKSKQILKVQLPDRTAVLCGLVEFGPMPINSSTVEKPQVRTLSFKDAFLYRFWENLDNIRHLNASKDSIEAFYELRSLIKTWLEMYEKLKKDFYKAEIGLNLETYLRQHSSSLHDDSDFKVSFRVDVENLIAKTSALLHEEFERLQEDKEK